MAKQKTKTKSAKTSSDEREFVIPLRRRYMNVPRYRRAKKAIKTIKEYLVRHMKIYDRDLDKIKIDKYLNEFVWARGIKRPPFKVKVKAKKNSDGTVSVELVEVPEKIKFKKAKIEKREAKATEIMEAKKTRMQKMKETAQGATSTESTSPKPEEQEDEKSEEKKKEEKEKQKAVVEAGQEMKKQAAKKAKHQTKQAKQSKSTHPKRQALKK